MFKKITLSLLVLTSLLIVNCKDTSNDHPIKEITSKNNTNKEAVLNSLYKQIVTPSFNSFNSAKIPVELTFVKDNLIKAKLKDESLIVSQGVVNYESEYIQSFILANELSKSIILKQAEILALGNVIPEGKALNKDTKKLFVSDLTTVYLLNKNNPKKIEFLLGNLEKLKVIFEQENTKIAAAKRINNIKNYLDSYLEKKEDQVFETTFEKVWNEGVSNEDKFKTLYLEKAKPLFKNFGYDLSFVPDEYFVIDGESLEAGAAPFYIEVSKGLINYKHKYIQIFALAHEMGHIYTLTQGLKFALETPIPEGELSSYKKAEYIADLFSIHAINKGLPFYKNLLEINFDELATILGEEDFYHPSGKDRVALLKKYLIKTSESSPDKAFEEIFKEIWTK